MSAAILPLPGAAAAAVANPRRRGRYPRGVVGLMAWRAARSAEAALPDVSPDPGQTHPVGTHLLGPDGDEVVVERGYGLHRVNEHDCSGRVALRYGYGCRRLDEDTTKFYCAGDLSDLDGVVTHLQPTWERP